MTGLQLDVVYVLPNFSQNQHQYFKRAVKLSLLFFFFLQDHYFLAREDTHVKVTGMHAIPFRV